MIFNHNYYINEWTPVLFSELSESVNLIIEPPMFFVSGFEIYTNIINPIRSKTILGGVSSVRDHHCMGLFHRKAGACLQIPLFFKSLYLYIPEDIVLGACRPKMVIFDFLVEENFLLQNPPRLPLLYVLWSPPPLRGGSETRRWTPKGSA